MYQIVTDTENHGTCYSSFFTSEWAVNMVAIGYVRHYPEVRKAEIVDLETGEVVKTYKKGDSLSMFPTMDNN